ncbi:MAG: class I SAM-dependent methyltransferase [Candidatus Bathyarchaeota archaeon]|nr:class I SAM-dependent methyltransferase [Candidatus Bathyarchaeota archaeon]
MSEYRAGFLFDQLNEFWAAIADAQFTKEETIFITKLIGPDGLILDLCCGTGRHSILLSKKGLDIVGLDLSRKLLKIAKKKQKDNNVAVSFIRGEMRHLPFRNGAFVATISMFTSYGYLPSAEEDLKSMKEVTRILQPNGLFLIDVANREHLIEVFKKKDWGEFPDFFMLEKRSLDTEQSSLHSRWILIDKKSRTERTFIHNLRLYSYQKLRSMLSKIGMRIETVYGEYDHRQKFSEKSTRLIILARRDGLKD